MKNIQRYLIIAVLTMTSLVITLIGAPLLTPGAVAAESGWGVQAITTPTNDIGASASTLVIAASNSPDKSTANYICDGVADQVQINAAIEALPSSGGKIMLLSGSFMCTYNIWLKPNLPLTIEGQGSNSVIYWDRSNFIHPLICHMYKGKWASLTDIVFKNFKIVNTMANPIQSWGIMTGWKLQDGSHRNITLDGLEAVGCGLWVANVNSGVGTITNCYVHDIAVGGEAMGIIRSSGYGKLYNNRIENVAEMGIGSQGDKYLEIHDNYMKGTGQDGIGFAIDTSTSTNVQVYNNTMVDCLHGIVSENSQGNINIHDNTFTGISTAGIGIEVWKTISSFPKASQIIITNNQVSNTGVGISLGDVNDAVVSYNSVKNIRRCAIQVSTNTRWGSNPENIQIHNNDLQNFAIESWQCGIAIARADNVNIADNKMDGNNNANSIGIRFTSNSAPHSTMTGNTITKVARTLVNIPKDIRLTKSFN
jgi:hypothetical protein